MTFSISSFKPYTTGLAVIATLVAGECCFRWHYFDWQGLLLPWRYSPAHMIQTDHVQAVHDDPFLGWALRPNVSGYLKGGYFSTNSFGMRNPQIELIKTPETFRIAVLGNSLTLGAGVDDHETFPAQLQTLFDERIPGRVEVLNFAVSSYRMPQMTALYDRLATRFDPDLVIVAMTAKALFSSRPLKKFIEPYGPFETRKYLQHVFVYRALRQFTGDVINAHLAGDWRRRGARNDGSPKRIKESEILGEFIALRHAERVPVALVILNAQGSSISSRRHAKIQNWADRHAGVELIIADPNKNESITERDSIYYGDRHPNARVQAEFARVIFDDLIKVENLGIADVAPTMISGRSSVNP